MHIRYNALCIGNMGNLLTQGDRESSCKLVHDAVMCKHSLTHQLTPITTDARELDLHPLK